jgi:hypothetical protein
MATVLEECTFEEKRSLVGLWCEKGPNAKDIRKEMLPVYGGKCLSRKAIHSWVMKRGNRFAEEEEEVETDERKWMR